MMKRITIKTDDGYAVENLHSKENKYYGEAIDQLAKYENMIESILLDQEELQRKIDELNNQDTGKIHWRVKEYMGKKLMNKGVLLALKNHGVDVEE